MSLETIAIATRQDHAARFAAAISSKRNSRVDLLQSLVIAVRKSSRPVPAVHCSASDSVRTLRTPAARTFSADQDHVREFPGPVSSTALP